MEQELLYTKKYKNCLINIYQDEDNTSPNEFQDENIFLVAYHDSFYVERDNIITKDEAISVANGEYNEDNRAKEIENNYYTFGLEAYIHSGVSLALSKEGNFPDRKWDVSQLGLVLIAKTEAKSMAKARKLAQGLIKTWNDYLSGNVYGFMALDEFGNDIGSCWGFYGYYETSGIIEEAKGEIDCYVKDELPKVKRKVARDKLYARHNINLLDLKTDSNDTIKRVAISLIKLLKIK